MLEWPDHFPESCPPEDAEPPEGTFYRLVESNPATEGDFVSNLRLQQLGIRNKKRKWSDECVAAALSVFTEAADAQYTKDSFGAMGHMLIACGDISEDGLLKHTPSSNCKTHHSWWLPVQSEPHQYFRIAS